jgi:hypothetical protein
MCEENTASTSRIIDEKRRNIIVHNNNETNKMTSERSYAKLHIFTLLLLLCSVFVPISDGNLFLFLLLLLLLFQLKQPPPFVRAPRRVHRLRRVSSETNNY